MKKIETLFSNNIIFSFSMKMVVGILIICTFISYLMLIVKSILFLLVPLLLIFAYFIGDGIFSNENS